MPPLEAGGGLDGVGPHGAPGRLIYVDDGAQNGQVSAAPGLSHGAIDSGPTDNAWKGGHAELMDGDVDECNDPPSLPVAVEALRSLLGSFDQVELAAMDARFYVHAYNELDLAGRTIIEAFDRERQALGDHRHE